MQKKNWCQSVSLPSPEDSYEDTNNATTVVQIKRRTAKIVRRKVPTVDTRAVLPQLVKRDITAAAVGYSTVETASFHTLDVFGDYHEEQSENGAGIMLCGWRRDEHARSKDDLAQYLPINRRLSLQSREQPNRLYSCRLNSRLSRKREQYSFKHCDSRQEHLQHYRRQCSFSQLVFSTKRDSTVQEVQEQQQDSIYEEWTTSQRAGVTKRSAAASRNTTSQPTDSNHLRGLASRLGVEESIRQPQLLQSPARPTPPSISKRRGNERTDELVIRAPGGSDDSKETKEFDADAKNSRKSSSKQQTVERHFPALTKPVKRNNSTSTISITKYLNVRKTSTTAEDSSNPNATNNNAFQCENDGGEEEDIKLVECDSNSLSSDSNHQLELEERDREERGNYDLWTLDPLETESRKDEMIRRKANSLGLLSHKWAKNFIERGFMNGHIPRKVFYDIAKSRPVTRDTSRVETARDGKNRTESRGDKQRSTTSSRKQGNRSNSISASEKLQKLETLYGSSSSNKKAPTERLHTASVKYSSRRLSSTTRGGGAANSRPPTRSLSHPMRKQNTRQESNGVLSHTRPLGSINNWQLRGERWERDYWPLN